MGKFHPQATCSDSEVRVSDYSLQEHCGRIKIKYKAEVNRPVVRFTFYFINQSEERIYEPM